MFSIHSVSHSHEYACPILRTKIFNIERPRIFRALSSLVPCLALVDTFWIQTRLNWLSQLPWFSPLLCLCSHLFTFSYCSWVSQGKNAEVVCYSLLQGTMFLRTLHHDPSILGGPTQHAFHGGSDGKGSACNGGNWVQSLGWEDPLEKEMATHSSTLAWKIPWTENPSRLQSMGSQRVGHNWATSLSHGMTHGFTELNKAVIHVICLVSFLWLWFSFCLPSDGW